MPLTVSPFVSLPTAATLSYNYKSMPSSLPLSSLGIPAAPDGSSSEQPRPKFVISPSGHAASPDDIVASCTSLLQHLTNLQESAEKELQRFENDTRERDLAERRRLAPGWLDSEARLLEPQKTTASQALDSASTLASQTDPPTESQSEVDKGGEELDRAFGSMALK